MILTLHRLLTNQKAGTIGALRLDGMPFCWTMEPYSLGNLPGASCIPAQEYPLYPYISGRYGRTWEVGDVYGRTFILFHPGNTAADTDGCILTGLKLGNLGGIPAVVESRPAFKALIKKLEDSAPHKLIIKENY
jgi:hypothetical protein